MIDPKTTSDVAKIKLDDIIEFMKTRPAEEITVFQAYANSTLKDAFGNDRNPCFFEVRNWVVNKYFPDVAAAVKKPQTKMIDKIMAL